LEQLNFSNAFYIKLGRGGMWEEDAIATGRLRLGWAESTIEDINAANWKVIHRQIRRELKGKPAGTVSADLNALKRIAESSPDDIWITFHRNKMWWTRLAAGKVRQDKTSKYRKTSQPWSDRPNSREFGYSPGAIRNFKDFGDGSQAVQDRGQERLRIRRWPK
jgi:hypothetical protein